MAVFSPTYVNSTTFRLDGADYTYYFPTGIMVRADIGSYVYSSVSSSTYSGGNTTVVLTQGVLTSGLTGIAVANTAPTAVPLHTHSGDDSGGTGVTGTAPEHQWDGTQVRFKQNTGSWGDYTDLEGPQGIQGETGPTGDSAPQNTYRVLSSNFSESNDGIALAIGNVPASNLIFALAVVVDTAASGGSPTITIGKSGDYDYYMTSSESDLTEADTYLKYLFQSVGGSQQTIYALVTASGQTFSGSVYMWYGTASIA
jgi:hypothetical protein